MYGDICGLSLQQSGLCYRQSRRGHKARRGRPQSVHPVSYTHLGFTGADLANLLNEAALLAARESRRAITMTDLEQAMLLSLIHIWVVISARSIGDVNVQVILEPLGGGGNAATAGAQVSGKTARQVLMELVASIDKFYEG